MHFRVYANILSTKLEGRFDWFNFHVLMSAPPRQYRWLYRKQDIDLIKLVIDKHPWTWLHGDNDKGWSEIASKLERFEGIHANGRGCRIRYLSLLNWSK